MSAPMLASMLLTVLAAEPRAQLHWSAKSSTCERAALERAVEMRLGYAPFIEEASTRVAIELNGFDGTVTVTRERSAPAIRRYTGAEDCRSLFDAMGLALAMAIDPLVMMRGPPAAPEPPAREVVRVHVVTAPVIAELVVPWQFAVQLAGGLELGAQPGGWFGVRAGALLSRGAFGVTLGPYLLVPSHTRFKTGAVDTMGTGADLGACFQRWPISVCAAARVGALRFDGRELDETRRGWALAAAVGPRVSVEWPRDTMFAFFATVELWVPLVRNRMIIDAVSVWEQPVIAGSLAVGATWRGP